MARSWSSWTLSLCAALVTASICAFLVLGSYTKRTTVPGVLTPTQGVIRIFPPAPGIVAERRANEGQQVNKGDVLFVMSDERQASDPGPIINLSDIQAETLAQRRLSIQRTSNSIRLLTQQTEQGLHARLESLQDQQKRNQQEIELQARRIVAATRMLERHQRLAQANFISEAALFEKVDQLEILRSQSLAAERQRSELANVKASIRNELQQTASRTASQLAELDRELSTLTQEAAEAKARHRFAVTAPVDGTLTAITVQVGQPAGAQPIATIIPNNGALVAELFAPSRAVGFVRVGQTVRLRYQAYPYQKFGHYTGAVAEVSRSPMQQSEISSALPFSPASQEPVYRIIVRLNSQNMPAHAKTLPLMPGMALEADIEQDNRKLIEWILEPLIGLNKHIL